MESILNWFREIINSLNSDKKTGFCVKEILVFSIFVLVVIVAWYDILNGTNTIITGPDATDMSYPAYYFIANSFKHFSIPLWNPYSFAGIPYMGYPQVTIVYPLNLIFYFLFDFNIHTFGYIALFHILLAGWFTYLLGRYAFNFNRYISVTMGLIFMLSPNFTMLINGFNMLIPFTWFPLIFLFTYKSFTSNENYIRNAVLGGLFLGISFLSAMPMITMMFVISLYLFFVLTNIKRFKEIRRLTLSIVIIFVIGICLGSVWFMPNMEYMARSIRFLGAQGTTVGMQRMNVEAFTYHIVDISKFLGLIKPRAGQCVAGNTFFGVVPVLLGLFSSIFLFRRNKIIIFSAIVSIVSILYSIGFVFPYIFIYIPIFNLIREPSRFLLFITFVLPVLSGFSLQYMFEKINLGEIIANIRLKRILIPLSLAIIAGFFTYNILILKIASFYPILIYFFVVIILLSIKQLQNNTKNRIFLSLTIIIIFIDLVSFKSSLKDLVSNFNVSNRKIDTNLDYYYNSVNSAGNYLKPKPTDEAFRVWACESKSGNPYCCGGGQLAGFYDVFGYGNPLLYKLYLFRNKGRNFNNLLNVKYYVSDLCSNFRIRTSDKLIESDILPVGYPSPMDQKKWSPLFIYENLNRYGPGWVVDSISYLDNKMYQDEILTKISDTKVDLKKVAFLVKNDLQEKDLQTINKINTSNDSLVYDIKLMEYNNNSIKLNVNSSKNALLVLSELYYPGWKVYVNGISEETLETDNLLRGVLIQKGSNFVEFKFRPTSFILGSIISILTFLLAISFLFINFKGYHYSRINIIIIALQFALIINFALGYLQVSSYKMNVKDKNAENKNRDVYKPGTNLIFSKDGNGVQYLKTGWSSSETNYTWSSSKKATIELPFESLPQNDINLKMKFSVYLKQNVLDSQSVKIFINDQKMDEMSIKDSKIVDYVLKIPKSIFENNNTLSITFELPDAFVPAQHGIGSDNRALGLCLRNLVIETIK